MHHLVGDALSSTTRDAFSIAMDLEDEEGPVELNFAIRGIKDMLGMTLHGEPREKQPSDQGNGASGVDITLFDTMVQETNEINVVSVLAAANATHEKVSHDMEEYRKRVDDELWGKTACLSVISKHRDLDQYDDIFLDLHRRRALAAALVLLKQIKALRAWRLWSYLQSSSRRERLKAGVQFRVELTRGCSLTKSEKLCLRSDMIPDNEIEQLETEFVHEVSRALVVDPDDLRVESIRASPNGHAVVSFRLIAVAAENEEEEEWMPHEDRNPRKQEKWVEEGLEDKVPCIAVCKRFLTQLLDEGSPLYAGALTAGVERQRSLALNRRVLLAMTPESSSKTSGDGGVGAGSSSAGSLDHGLTSAADIRSASAADFLSAGGTLQGDRALWGWDPVEDTWAATETLVCSHTDAGRKLLLTLNGGLFKTKLPRVCVLHTWRNIVTQQVRYEAFRRQILMRNARLQFELWKYAVSMSKYFRQRMQVRFLRIWRCTLSRRKRFRWLMARPHFERLPLLHRSAFRLWFANALIVARARSLLRKVHRRYQRECMLSWVVEWRIGCYCRLQTKRRIFVFWYAKYRQRRRIRRLLCRDAFLRLPLNRRVVFNVFVRVMKFCRGMETWGKLRTDSRYRDAFGRWHKYWQWSGRVIAVYAGQFFKRKMPMRYNTAFTEWVRWLYWKRAIERLAKRFQQRKYLTPLSVYVFHRRQLRCMFERRVWNTWRRVQAGERRTLVALTRLANGWRKCRLGAALMGRMVDERAALTQLYKATNGKYWAKQQNWLTDKPLSEWQGVGVSAQGSCAGAGKVTKLVLCANGLVGKLPACVGQLVYLEELWLDDNALFGQIPWRLGALTNLTLLGLSNNKLTGALPAAISNMQRLEVLDVEANAMVGEVPDLSALHFLIRLNISSNKFHGSLPKSIASSAFLEELHVYNTPIGGTIPNTIANCRNLAFVSLYESAFEGQVPQDLARCFFIRSLAHIPPPRP
jgi:hypothetical protein